MDKKNTPLDQAICPGCARLYTRAQLAAELKGVGYFCCRSCQYECQGSWPRRPLTTREMLMGQWQRTMEYNNVDLEGYVRALVAVLSGS